MGCCCCCCVGNDIAIGVCGCDLVCSKAERSIASISCGEGSFLCSSCINSARLFNNAESSVVVFCPF